MRRVCSGLIEAQQRALLRPGPLADSLPQAVSFLSLSTDLVTQAYPDEPLAVSAEATVGEVVALMKAQRGSCVLVCASGDCEGQIEGIFTERDALKWMAGG